MTSPAPAAPGAGAAAGPVQFSSLTNERVDAYRWTYSGTVIYGTVNSSGQITQYGKLSLQNKISLQGNVALLDPFWAQRSLYGRLRDDVQAVVLVRDQHDGRAVEGLVPPLLPVELQRQ